MRAHHTGLMTTDKAERIVDLAPQAGELWAVAAPADWTAADVTRVLRQTGFADELPQPLRRLSEAEWGRTNQRVEDTEEGC